MAAIARRSRPTARPAVGQAEANCRPGDRQFVSDLRQVVNLAPARRAAAARDLVHEQLDLWPGACADGVNPVLTHPLIATVLLHGRPGGHGGDDTVCVDDQRYIASNVGNRRGQSRARGDSGLRSSSSVVDTGWGLGHVAIPQGALRAPSGDV